jgi:hypothetical protein
VYIKKQNVEIDSPASTREKGSTRNMLACLGLRLRQHCQFLTVAFFGKQFFEKEVVKTKEIAINTES